jgi:hypothetical protein
MNEAQRHTDKLGPKKSGRAPERRQHVDRVLKDEAFAK